MAENLGMDHLAHMQDETTAVRHVRARAQVMTIRQRIRTRRGSSRPCPGPRARRDRPRKNFGERALRYDQDDAAEARRIGGVSAKDRRKSFPPV